MPPLHHMAAAHQSEHKFTPLSLSWMHWVGLSSRPLKMTSNTDFGLAVGDCFAEILKSLKISPFLGCQSNLHTKNHYTQEANTTPRNTCADAFVQGRACFFLSPKIRTNMNPECLWSSSITRVSKVHFPPIRVTMFT